MQAAYKFEDVTSAEDGGSGVFRKPDVEEYASANPVRAPSLRLISPGPRMQVRTQIVVGRRRYHLKDVFVVDLEYAESGDVFANHRQLHVYGEGNDLRQALSSFCETFDFQWRNLVDVDAGSLTASGRLRRQAMEAVVDGVEQI